MKKIIGITLFTAAFFTAGFASAAQELMRDDTHSLMKTGVVSAGGATSLEQLNTQLAMKAQEEGATGYLITGVTGNNKLHGTATLYR